MKKKAVCLLLGLFLAFSAAACGGAEGKMKDRIKALGLMEGAEMNDTFYNPIRNDQGLGDPWMFKHTDGYYYYTHSTGSNIVITRSKDMTRVTADNSDTNVTKVIFNQKSIGVVEIWAPEIFFFDGHFYAYFTATLSSKEPVRSDNRKSYGMKSVTDDAFGAWESAQRIALPVDTHSIDATFLNYDNRQFIIWSGWASKVNDGYKSLLYMTELETGNPLKAKSTAASARVQLSTPEHSWETHGARQNEGPAAMLAPDGLPVIFFTGSHSKTDLYCVNYVKLIAGMDIMSGETHGNGSSKSFFKPSEADGPLLQLDAEIELYGPGHCSVTKSPDGEEDWMVFHAVKVANDGAETLSAVGWDRMTLLHRVSWTPDGHPRMERVTGTVAEMTLPSGQASKKYKYEAEDAQLSEGCQIIQEKDFASGDKAVLLGRNDGVLTDSIRFNFDVPKSAKYFINIRFSNYEGYETAVEVYTNGELSMIYTPKTQQNYTYMMTGYYATLFWREEANTIEIKCDKTIRIDCVIVDYMI
jgi:GH43 family beta-xylosidase